MTDDCCDSGLLVGPTATSAARLRGVRGFVALWRGERALVTDLADGDAATIETLVRAGRLEIDRDGRLSGVHGLVARPTAHRIEHSEGAAHTWCALDAIGIPAALGIDATAVTHCPTCSTELRVVLHDGAPVDLPDYRLWIPSGQCAHLVEDFCRHANLFCNDTHLTATSPGPDGRAVDVSVAAAIGRTMWDDVAREMHDRRGERAR